MDLFRVFSLPDILSSLMPGAVLEALSCGVIASARSPGGSVPESARSSGDKGGSGSSTGRAPVLCEPQTLAAPNAVAQTAAGQAVCLSGGGGVAPECGLVVYRHASEEVADPGRVPGSEHLQEGHGVPPSTAAMQCSTGQAVRLSINVILECRNRQFRPSYRSELPLSYILRGHLNLGRLRSRKLN